MIYEDDMRRILNKHLEKGGANKFADEHGISRSFISDMRHGKRRITERVADILGYVRFTGFKRKSEK